MSFFHPLLFLLPVRITVLRVVIISGGIHIRLRSFPCRHILSVRILIDFRLVTVLQDVLQIFGIIQVMLRFIYLEIISASADNMGRKQYTFNSAAILLF